MSVAAEHAGFGGHTLAEHRERRTVRSKIAWRTSCIPIWGSRRRDSTYSLATSCASKEKNLLENYGHPSGTNHWLKLNGHMITRSFVENVNIRLTSRRGGFSPLEGEGFSSYLASLAGYSISVRPNIFAMKSPSASRYLFPPSCSLRVTSVAGGETVVPSRGVNM